MSQELERHWPEIRSLAEASDLAGLKSLAAKVSGPADKIAFLRFMIRSLTFNDWKGRDLDLTIALGDFAVDQALMLGLTDQANVICYNLSANLADCWNDGIPRRASQFAKGLEYADRALAFRKELKKGPGPFYMAHWARGTHLALLGRGEEAVEAYGASLEHARASAREQGKTELVAAEGAFEVILATGYLAIVRGDEAGLARALAAFEGMKGISAEAKEDAQVGVDQLTYFRKRLKG